MEPPSLHSGLSVGDKPSPIEERCPVCNYRQLDYRSPSQGIYRIRCHHHKYECSKKHWKHTCKICVEMNDTCYRWHHDPIRKLTQEEFIELYLQNINF